MTREQAIAIIHQEYLCVDRDCNIEKNCGNCDLAMPSKEPILEAYNMAIKALDQETCTDAISRQAVLETIRDFEYKNSHEEMLIISRIKELQPVTPAENSSKWIPVLERYPEDGQHILFSTKTGCVFEGRYSADTSAHNWLSYKDDTYAWNNVVTAWMPLPEPYNASLTGAESDNKCQECKKDWTKCTRCPVMMKWVFEMQNEASQVGEESEG